MSRFLSVHKKKVAKRLQLWVTSECLKWLKNNKGVKLDNILHIMNQDFWKISTIDKMAAFWKKVSNFAKKKASVFCIANLQFLTDQKDSSSWYVKPCADYNLEMQFREKRVWNCNYWYLCFDDIWDPTLIFWNIIL